MDKIRLRFDHIAYVDKAEAAGNTTPMDYNEWLEYKVSVMADELGSLQHENGILRGYEEDKRDWYSLGYNDGKRDMRIEVAQEHEADHAITKEHLKDADWLANHEMDVINAFRHLEG